MKNIKILLAACILTSSILTISPSAWAGDNDKPHPKPGPAVPDGNPFPPPVDPQNPIPAPTNPPQQPN